MRERADAREWKAMFFVLATLLVAADAPAATIDAGYRQMYSLQFDEAHRTFEAWKKANPDDGFGYVSDAAAYLFAEFHRLRVLEAEFFLEDQGFRRSDKMKADAAVKAKFDEAVATGERLADAAIAKSNGADKNALLAKSMAHGLRADYLGMIEKKYLAALGFVKSGRVWAQKILDQDAKYGDAYIAVGGENYLLSLRAAPVRWVLNWTGAETDRAKGIAAIKMCVEHGRYMKPFARLLLGVAAMREKRYGEAREVLHGLARDFPGNPLYLEQAAKLPK